MNTRIRQSLQTLRALYSGISGPLATVGLVQAINFAVYDSTRRYLNEGQDYNQVPDSLAQVSTAGFVSGAAVALITSPLVLVKTRQQILGVSIRQAVDATKGQGMRGLFVGMGPHLLSETIGRAVYYATYEQGKRSIAQYKYNHAPSESHGASQLSIPDRMMAAAMAGIVSWTVIFPWDALKNRLYHQHIVMASHNATILPLPKRSALQMTEQMIREGSLYRGMTVTVLRAGPVAAAVLPVYDTVVQYLHDNY